MLKRILFALGIAFMLYACKKERIIIEGYVVDDKTGNSFKPCKNMVVYLRADQGYGAYKDLGKASVDQYGHYKMEIKYPKVDFECRLKLYSYDEIPDQDHFIIVKNYVKHNFKILCNVRLNRVYTPQSSDAADSMRVYITNTKGTFLYRVPDSFSSYSETYILPGRESNYITSYIYSNGTHITDSDVIYSDCNTVVNDILKY